MLEKREDLPPKLGGGPHGLGDPDDKRLRKTEKDIIIPKMLKEEAQKRCDATLQLLHSCAKEAGLAVVWKCQEENKKNNECLAHWMNDPQLIDEITNKYLDARSYYRKTGEPLVKYERKKKSSSGFC